MQWGHCGRLQYSVRIPVHCLATAPLWHAVRQETNGFYGLVPLPRDERGREWHPRVTPPNSGTILYAFVGASDLGSEMARQLGRARERSRLKKRAENSARERNSAHKRSSSEL